MNPVTTRRGRPMSNGELAEALCAVSVALREVRRVHLESFGTLIPHVFMGEVLARVGAHFTARAERPGAVEVAAILELLEDAMSCGDRETRNVVSMSFASDGELEPFFPQLKPMLGARVLAQLNGR